MPADKVAPWGSEPVECIGGPFDGSKRTAANEVIHLVWPLEGVKDHHDGSVHKYRRGYGRSNQLAYIYEGEVA